MVVLGGQLQVLLEGRRQGAARLGRQAQRLWLGLVERWRAALQDAARGGRGGPVRVARAAGVLAAAFLALFLVLGHATVPGGQLPRDAGSPEGARLPFPGACKALHRRVQNPRPLKRKAMRTYTVHRATPGPMQYVHMATIERPGVLDGRLAVAWQASSGLEGIADQHLAVSFSEDAAGSAWGEARRIPLPQDGPLWAPVLHTDSRGRLWLFYAESNECRITSTPPRYSPGGSVKAAVYGLGGQARWSKPREIYGEEDGDGLPKVLANKLIVLSTGEWVLPVWSEKHGTCDGPETGEPSAVVLVSEDEGGTWARRGRIRGDEAGTWLIENTVAEQGDGDLLMFFRTSKGKIFQSVSHDKGFKWNRPHATSLPNPDAKVHMLKLEDTALALAYNAHVRNDVKSKARTNLDVSISLNDGRSWRKVAHLETRDEQGLRFHYPTMLQSGCTLYVAYSKFFHEEFAAKARWDLLRTAERDPKDRIPELGIMVKAIDLS